MKILLKIFLGLIILGTLSCKRTEIVVVSITAPSSVKGSVLVLDKRKFEVFNPATSTKSFMVLRGYHIIHKQDLETLYKAYKASKK